MIWILAALVLGGVLFLAINIAGSPSRLLDHVTYISGTLGTGKTSYAALVARECRAKNIDYYSTFVLDGAFPLDLDLDEWPETPQITIILDELLLLEANKFIDWGKFADGLALARQKEQRVIILSQAHRPGWGKVSGTIGTYGIVRGWSLGMIGRLIQMRRSSEPFSRIAGYRAPGTVRSWHWIPASVFKDYNSKMIFGYTCDKNQKKFTRVDMENRRIERDARRESKKALTRSLAQAAASAARRELDRHGGTIGGKPRSSSSWPYKKGH
jgi:hypothetical protein